MDHYCSAGDGSSILRLFREMRQSSGVHFDAESYALILGSLAKFGYFCSDGSVVEGAEKVGFKSAGGPELFDEIAAEMAEDLLEISEATAKSLMIAFQDGFKETDVSFDGSGDIPLIPKEMDDSALAMGRVQIDDKTALCPASGAKLRLFALAEEQRQHVHDTLLEMARIRYQEFTKKKKNKEEGEDYGFEELSNFSSWLE